MKHSFLPAAVMLAFMAAVAHADDPPQPPRTHIDTTVVGDAERDTTSGTAEAATLDNDHQFQAGAPELVKLTQQLNLSRRQKAQLNDAIERADAGAAVLIKREHDVRDMLAATTPQDPLYTKLLADQSDGAARWAENRESLRREVIDLLTPAQRARFEELQTAQGS
ncbi:MAG: Spy/CpxP family protein refolding chaperone [Steroidobacteraceae bacterium]|jgi:Spy/CpxP family protein refolding chaperone